jgi:hypothetical protein
MPVGLASELPLADFAALLAGRAPVTGALVDGIVDADAVFLESFLRWAAREDPIRCPARIAGKVEFRAGEGPLFEIRMGAVEIETSCADALFSWSGDDGPGNAVMPLSSLSLYIIQGSVVLGR